MKVKAIKLSQKNNELYLFTARAKDLWAMLQINERSEDKEDGYQRTLSVSRAEDIKKFIASGNPVAPAIVISLSQNHARFDDVNAELEIDDVSDAGWVIDGQHRLRGADLADVESDLPIELPVVAFIGLDDVSQIAQFVTINREAKGVPTSLYYDLLKHLPAKKKPAEVAKEKAASIAESLRKNNSSPFFEKIVVVTSPKPGQISLNNFVRKVYPLIVEGKGQFDSYSQMELIGIFDNYFKALKLVFPDEFSIGKNRFFKTLGFGAAINALSTVFNITLKDRAAFRVEDARATLEKISDFNFSAWDNIGTGSAAEIQAGKDLESSLRVEAGGNSNSTLTLF